MGFFDSLFGGDEPDYGTQAVRAEKIRQAQINQGMAQLSSIFEGGSYTPYNRVLPGTKWGEGTSYWLSKDGKTFEAITGKPEGYKDNVSKGWLYTAGTPVQGKGFDESFYNNYENSYINNATPQLAKQYQDTWNAIQYGLANRGLSTSSAGGKAKQELDVQMAKNKQSIADQAIKARQELQSNVLSAYMNAVNQLYATGDPSTATQSAIATVSQLQAPSAFATLSNMFSNMANQYSMQQMYSNNYNSGETYSNYGSSMPGTANTSSPIGASWY